LGITYGTEPLLALFSDEGFTTAFLEFEQALLDTQEELGLVPRGEAAKLAAIGVTNLDLERAGITALKNGNPVSGLVEQVHGHAPYAHYGVTAHDAWDVAHVLQLRQAMGLIFQDIRTTVAHLAERVEAHADTPMVARTQGQVGAPTTLGLMTGSLDPVLSSWENDRQQQHAVHRGREAMGLSTGEMQQLPGLQLHRRAQGMALHAPRQTMDHDGAIHLVGTPRLTRPQRDPGQLHVIIPGDRLGVLRRDVGRPGLQVHDLASCCVMSRH
jgi:adenylosuccinate lyase